MPAPRPRTSGWASLRLRSATLAFAGALPAVSGLLAASHTSGLGAGVDASPAGSVPKPRLQRQSHSSSGVSIHPAHRAGFAGWGLVLTLTSASPGERCAVWLAW